MDEVDKIHALTQSKKTTHDKSKEQRGKEIGVETLIYTSRLDRRRARTHEYKSSSSPDRCSCNIKAVIPIIVALFHRMLNT